MEKAESRGQESKILTKDTHKSHCPFKNIAEYDPDLLIGVVRPEEVVVNGEKRYNLGRAYCSLTREELSYFREVCPRWFDCPLADGKTHGVKSKPK